MEDKLYTVLEMEGLLEVEPYVSALESILFAAGEAVRKKDLMRILSLREKDLDEVIASLQEELSGSRRGIRLMILENRIQLGTKECNTHYLKELLGVNDRQSLSKGALECLSIIAFKQPVTRVDIDEIRGVNSDYVLTKLQEKGLIKAVGRKDAPGRPKLYGTTDDFLIQFGFSSIREMREGHEIPQRVLEMDQKKKEAEKDEIELFEED